MKKTLTVATAALLALSLAACGSAASSSEATASSEVAASSEAASSEAATSSEAAASTAAGKTWLIATDTAFMPFEYTDESGSFVGIDMDILAAVAEDQGFTYELQISGWDAAIAGCQSGQFDGMIAGASITDERKASGWMFSDGYYTATQTIAVAADSGITKWEDLAGKNVAVKNGAMGATYAESLKDTYGFTVTKFEDSPTMYQDVLAGNSAACFDDTPVMAAYIKQHDLALTIPDGFENEGAEYGFAIMNADNQELLDRFNAGLANIKASGKYDEILKTYLG